MATDQHNRQTDGQNVAGAAQRIVIILHDLGLGGTERIAIRLANRWARCGRAVTIFCGVLEGNLVDLVENQVEVVECDPPIRRGFGSRRRLSAAFKNYVAEQTPDVVFVPGNFHWPVIGTIRCLPPLGRPAIVAQISSPIRKASRKPWRQRLWDMQARRKLRGVSRCVSLSPAMTADADALLGRGLTQCIRLPVLDDYSPQPLCAASGGTILACGRLAREKGFDVALRAFALLNDPETRLTIVGEGPMQLELAALAETLGISDRVHMPGFVPDVRPWLRRSRVFLLSSHHEGYSAALVEALAEGRPVVATECTPAVAELLTSPGFCRVAPIGNAAALAMGLRQVLDAPAPDPHVLALSVAGYRIGPISEVYLRLFDEVVARGQGNG